jgi:hypothetical protein
MKFSDLPRQGTDNLIESIKSEYSINESKISDLISRYHKDTRLSNTLIESYKQKIHSKEFSLDPVILESRNLFTNLLDNKIDFQLSDGSKVAIDWELLENLNITLAGDPNVIEFMRENSENFIAVCKLVLEGINGQI